MIKYVLLITLCFITTLVSCNVESDLDDQILTNKQANIKTNNVIISESNSSSDEDGGEHCTTVNLIAGQNHMAGVVTIDIEGDNLIVSYQTNLDWFIDATHLHITNCEADGFPTTGAGNPKIGNFDYSTTHEDGVTEVTYIFNLADLNIDEAFCFAAHAEVSGPSEETAWAEGEDFDGKSWAMFVEADITDCEEDEGDGGGGPY